MNDAALAPLLAMQQATSVVAATSHAIDAIEAGATADEANQALNEWMQVQGRQVQQLFAEQRRPDCCTGIHREHPQTADITDYLRQKGELA